jgi:hypothetical protein
MLVPVGGGGYKARVKEGEYGGNTMYSCMKMEQWVETILREEGRE